MYILSNICSFLYTLMELEPGLSELYLVCHSWLLEPLYEPINCTKGALLAKEARHLVITSSDILQKGQEFSLSPDEV